MDQREVEERLGEEAWRVLPWTAQAFASGQRSRSRSRQQANEWFGAHSRGRPPALARTPPPPAPPPRARPAPGLLSAAHRPSSAPAARAGGCRGRHEGSRWRRCRGRARAWRRRSPRAGGTARSDTHLVAPCERSEGWGGVCVGGEGIGHVHENYTDSLACDLAQSWADKWTDPE